MLTYKMYPNYDISQGQQNYSYRQDFGMPVYNGKLIHLLFVLDNNGK